MWRLVMILAENQKTGFQSDSDSERPGGTEREAEMADRAPAHLRSKTASRDKAGRFRRPPVARKESEPARHHASNQENFGSNRSRWKHHLERTVVVGHVSSLKTTFRGPSPKGPTRRRIRPDLPDQQCQRNAENHRLSHLDPLTMASRRSSRSGNSSLNFCRYRLICWKIASSERLIRLCSASRSSGTSRRST